MRAFSVWALPAFALGLTLTLSPAARAETDPIITGEPPANRGTSDFPAPPAPSGAPSEPPASAPDQPKTAGPSQPAESRTERLDRLFTELKKASTQEAAAKIAGEIDSVWRDSGSATVDLLMLWATSAVAKENSAAALDLLEQAIILKPDYAEAWNRRATVNYVTSAYGKSIADIEKTLSLEPRHYGALMGLGMILEDTDRKPQALEVYMRVLAIYPALKGAQDAVGRLSEELTGQRI